MKRPNWEVKTYGIRPAGKQDECHYCGAAKTEQHKPDCVIGSRTVVVKMEIDLVVAVPESWTPEEIEFHRNDGSWCSSNVLGELKRLAKAKDCICEFTRFQFVREATEEDEARQGIFVNKLPS